MSSYPQLPGSTNPVYPAPPGSGVNVSSNSGPVILKIKDPCCIIQCFCPRCRYEGCCGSCCPKQSCCELYCAEVVKMYLQNEQLDLAYVVTQEQCTCGRVLHVYDVQGHAWNEKNIWVEVASMDQGLCSCAFHIEEKGSQKSSSFSRPCFGCKGAYHISGEGKDWYVRSHCCDLLGGGYVVEGKEGQVMDVSWGCTNTCCRDITFKISRAENVAACVAIAALVVLF